MAPSSRSSVAKIRSEASSSAARPASRSTFGRQVDQPLRLAHGERATGSDLFGDRRRPRDALRLPARPRGRGRSAAASSAVRTRPVRISSLARAMPTTVAAAACRPAPGVTARRTSGRPSRRAFRRDPQVAGKRELETATERVALDGGDRRHRQLGKAAGRRAARARVAHGRRDPAGPRTRRRASRRRTPARRSRSRRRRGRRPARRRGQRPERRVQLLEQAPA